MMGLSFMRNRAAGEFTPPVSASFDFTMSTLAGATSWNLNTIATVLLTGVDPDDFQLEIVNSAGASGDDTGLVGVNG